MNNFNMNTVSLNFYSQIFVFKHLQEKDRFKTTPEMNSLMNLSAEHNNNNKMKNYQNPSPIALRESEMTSQHWEKETKNSNHNVSNEISLLRESSSKNPLALNKVVTPEIILEHSSNSSDTGVPRNQIVFFNEYFTKANNQEEELELKYEEEFIPQKSEKNRPNQLISKSTEKEKNKSSQFSSIDKPFCSLGIPNENESEINETIGLSRKKTVLNEIEVQEDCKIYKNGRWSKTKLMMFKETMSFFEFSFNISDLKKIKILPSDATKQKIENIVKLQINQEASLFSIATDKKYLNLPTSFYIFAKLITKKIYEHIHILNPTTVSTSNTNDSYIHGEIYKKSQHFGNWEKRYVIIKSDGIYSFKDSKQEEPFSFFINNQSVKYIWTRFDIIESHLVIKVKHGISKTEFGIPLADYCGKGTGNWLYGFYRTIAGQKLY